MAADPVHAAELRAMERLGWTARELLVATMQYGDVGTIGDVREHLATGNHLPPGRKAFIAAALWDAEIGRADRHREDAATPTPREPGQAPTSPSAPPRSTPRHATRVLARLGLRFNRAVGR